MERIFVEVVELAPFTLRITHQGSALTTQLGRELEGGFTSDHGNVLGDLSATYRRCVRLREPSHELMRLKLDDGNPTQF